MLERDVYARKGPLVRSRFEAPGTVLVNKRLRSQEERLKYELAFFVGHKILHNGDGIISPHKGVQAGEAETQGSAAGMGAQDVLFAWRDFECSFFAGALLCPRIPFRRFLVREAQAGRLSLPLKPIAGKVLVHGHCHQKSFGAFPSVGKVLRLVPDLQVEIIESSCCGMAGAFGYGADTFDVSLEMAELSLLPAVRQADAQTLIVADGTSCRHQIHDGTGRDALHVARVLQRSLENARSAGRT